MDSAGTQWASIQDIDDVPRLDNSDYACFEEIKETLKRHGKLERFGVTLLHKHFDLSENEMLMETTDKANRVQTIQPIKMDGAPSYRETQWRFFDKAGMAIQACVGCIVICAWGGSQHVYKHTHGSN